MAFAPIPARLPPDWPFRDRSRTVHAAPHLWHVQELGDGPLLLLLHGAGASTHTWRNLAPLLAPHYRLAMVDLPGQGFTRLGSRMRCGLDAIAEDLARLCTDQGWQPQAVIGHSAGGALALRLAERMPLKAVAGINAALGNFDGAAGVVFPVLARLLALNPAVPSLFARLAGTEAQVRRLLGSTGSRIDAEGVRLYRRLVGDPAHVDGTLAMMAQWQLGGLLSRLPGIGLPVLFICGADDRTVPPQVSRDAAARLPDARVEVLAGFGHLVHEEAAAETAALLLPFLGRFVAAGAGSA